MPEFHLFEIITTPSFERKYIDLDSSAPSLSRRIVHPRSTTISFNDRVVVYENFYLLINARPKTAYIYSFDDVYYSISLKLIDRSMAEIGVEMKGGRGELTSSCKSDLKYIFHHCYRTMLGMTDSLFRIFSCEAQGSPADKDSRNASGEGLEFYLVPKFFSEETPLTIGETKALLASLPLSEVSWYGSAGLEEAGLREACNVRLAANCMQKSIGGETEGRREIRADVKSIYYGKVVYDVSKRRPVRLDKLVVWERDVEDLVQFLRRNKELEIICSAFGGLREELEELAVRVSGMRGRSGAGSGGEDVFFFLTLPTLYRRGLEDLYSGTLAREMAPSLVFPEDCIDSFFKDDLVGDLFSTLFLLRQMKHLAFKLAPFEEKTGYRFVQKDLLARALTNANFDYDQFHCALPEFDFRLSMVGPFVAEKYFELVTGEYGAEGPSAPQGGHEQAFWSRLDGGLHFAYFETENARLSALGLAIYNFVISTHMFFACPLDQARANQLKSRALSTPFISSVLGRFEAANRYGKLSFPDLTLCPPASRNAKFLVNCFYAVIAAVFLDSNSIAPVRVVVAHFLFSRIGSGPREEAGGAESKSTRMIKAFCTERNLHSDEEEEEKEKDDDESFTLALDQDPKFASLLDHVANALRVKINNPNAFIKSFLSKQQLVEISYSTDKEFLTQESNTQVKSLGSSIVKFCAQRFLLGFWEDPKYSVLLPEFNSKKTFAKFLRDLQIDEQLQKILSDKRKVNLENYLSSCFLGILGSIYLDSTLGVCFGVLQKLFRNHATAVGEFEMNPKSELLLLVSSNIKRKLLSADTRPKWENQEHFGETPGQQKEFRSKVYINSHLYGEGTAPTVAEAEKIAARCAIKKFETDISRGVKPLFPDSHSRPGPTRTARVIKRMKHN